jgi:hypothetical protein
MEQELSTVSLTDYQKEVLAKAVLAGSIDSPSKVSLNDTKLINARDLLDELGIIEYSYEDDTIKINDDKIQLLQQDGIIDDSQQLTPEMQQLINPDGDPQQNNFMESVDLSDLEML